jgi:hypothetical protein
VRVNHPAVLDDILPRLPPGWRESQTGFADELFSVYCGGDSAHPRVRRYDILYQGAERLVRTLDRGELLAGLEGALKLCVAERARGYVFLHAGVVGWQGGAILIPGRSRSGKSRLVDALLRRGATYYSDEYAVLDGRARVHPYLAPLSLRRETGEARRLPPQALGAGARPPLSVRLVVLTRYRAGATWKPRRISPGRAVLGLLDHAIPARRRPRDVLALLSRIASLTPVLRSLRGEADAVAARLLAG